MQPIFRQDPAPVLALDHGGLEAELRRADGGDVAARPGADHHDSICCIAHRRYLSTFWVLLACIVPQLIGGEPEQGVWGSARIGS
jgi:hypothetical protein